MIRPDVTHTTGGEPISQVETFGSFAIGKARLDWLLGSLVERTETTYLTDDSGAQLALPQARQVVELKWEWSCSETIVRQSAIESATRGRLVLAGLAES